MEIARSEEAEAFLTTVDVLEPDRVSACDGWTTHEVVAHAVGIHVEVCRHLEPYLQGDEVPQTRGFEEREAPLQATGHEALLGRLEHEERRMRQLVADVLEREPEARIPWTGRTMAAADRDFLVQLRSDPEPTLLVRVSGGQAGLEWARDDGANEGGPTVELDPVARHLFIWGRRPDRHDRVRSHLARPALARLQALLSGY